MGWSSFTMHKPVKEWFKANISEGYEVLDSALVKRNTLYAAIKVISTGEVYCSVYLIRWSRDEYNFSYKPMTEHVGPGVCDCPKRIMKLLTPLDEKSDDNGWAKEWRERVNQYWVKADLLKNLKGRVIKLDEPVNFTSGASYQYFIKDGRNTVAGVMIDGKFEQYSRVRINLKKFNFELIENKC